MNQLRVFYQELRQGKSLFRTLQNLVFADIVLSGAILDVAGGKDPSYKRFLKTDSDSKWFRADYNPSYQPDFQFDASEQWPITDDSFDTVLLINCLYIFKNPQGVVREAARVLRKGGKLVVAVPMVFHESPEPADYHRFTSEGIRLLIENAGMAVETVRPHGGRFTCAVDLLSGYLKKIHLFLPLVFVAQYLDGVLGQNQYEQRHPIHCGYVVVAVK